MTAPRTLTRNATLDDLVTLLREDHARKADFLVSASQIRSEGGVLVVSGADADITEDGVTTVDGRFRPTQVMDDGLAEKLGIPPAYLRRMRADAPDMYDQNVNGWLHGTSEYGSGERNPQAPGYRVSDPRRFMVRTFRGDSGGEGVGRAFLSDSYKRIENIDVLLTALDGIRDCGIPIQIAGCDLTERRMYVRVWSDAVAVDASALLGDYRSGSRTAKDFPLMFAGWELANSEVGLGAFTITPRVVFQVCTNGQTITRDAMRAQHLGGKMEDIGLVTWSDKTQQKNLELVRSMTTDAVTAFMSATYLERVAGRLAVDAGVEIAKPEETIKHVVQKLRYTQTQQDDILSAFIKGGSVTAGGVMQAFTAVAQATTDADTAADYEADADKALAIAAAYNR